MTQIANNLERFETWLDQVRAALDSINMPFEEWQRSWNFDFQREYKAGSSAVKAAEKANRFWWYEQNKALRQECDKTAQCWLPRGHQGVCEPV
jgi:hypothetical protein